MLFHTYAMTSAVHKPFAIPGCIYNGTSSSINAFTRCAHCARSNSGSLCFEQHCICIRNICWNFTQVDTSSDVAAVTIHCSAKVAQHNLAKLNYSISRMVVWARCILSCSNDRKVHFLMTFSNQSRRDISRYFCFSTTNKCNVACM